MHSHILKVNKEKEKAARLNSELKSYMNKFWRTAKTVTVSHFLFKFKIGILLLLDAFIQLLVHSWVTRFLQIRLSLLYF